MERELTPRQARFVREYLIDRNATQAYLRAGYRVSASVARRAASRLLTNVDVRAAVAEGERILAETAGWTQRRVLEALEHNLEGARTDQDWRAANEAIVKIGQHIGMWPERGVQIAGEKVQVIFDV